ncbi:GLYCOSYLTRANSFERASE [Salix purpurea]|uniref:Glycosyltransferase n=1 Tax=Salix purpurea TaxID=77065 RepID=A0A9Q0YXB6_SALPP|nr:GLYCOSYLTRANSFERASE [Salix purpurea]
MAEPKENIVMFPFMAQGHIIPFLALALHIEKTKSFTITFVNTPLNIKKLKSSIPPDSSIKLLEIPFNSSDHGLPPNSENTDILPYPLIISLLHASTSLKPAFKTLIEDIIEEQEAVLVDLVWLAITLSGQRFLIEGVDSDEFELKDFKEASRFHVSQLPLSILAADGSDSWSVFQRMNLPAWVDSNGILFNTVEEFDQLGLMYFRKRLGRPAWAIGPVLLSVDHRARAGKQSGISADFLKNWLDTKPVSSVLYVSFGSNNTISTSQMMQLALALEGSGKNFIWVVRPPIGFDINSEFKDREWLPEGFEERIKDSGRGLLVQKWAPQVEILSHKSICAFLSHCGWNSVLEALNNGVPLLGWAMAGEQFFNVKFLEERVGEKGKEMRRKASEVKEMIRNAIRDEDGFKGSSVKELDDFFQAAMVMRDGADHKA